MKFTNLDIVESNDGTLWSLHKLAEIQDKWLEWVLNSKIYKIQDKEDSNIWYPAILVNKEAVWDFFINNGQEGYSPEKYNYLETEIKVKDYLSDESNNLSNNKEDNYRPTIYVYYKDKEDKSRWFGIDVIHGYSFEEQAKQFSSLQYIWLDWLSGEISNLLLPEYPKEKL